MRIKMLLAATALAVPAALMAQAAPEQAPPADPAATTAPAPDAASQPAPEAAPAAEPATTDAAQPADADHDKHKKDKKADKPE